MKGRPIDQVVYECMFPKPKTGDPQSFQAFLQRSLVPEVRHETQAFYGHLTSQEAKYPGLDYSYPPHRVRLSRFPWHRRLFRAFDNLKLTKHEIATLTKWEGTRWAKERFEKEQGILIRDTTGDGIEDWVPLELRPRSIQGIQYTAPTSEEEELEDDGQAEENNPEEDGESDTEITSVGTALNERLRAAAAQRAAGNLTAIMDPEWEEWMKDAVEGNINISSTELSPDAMIMGTRPMPMGVFSTLGLTIPANTTSTRPVQRRSPIHRVLGEANSSRSHAQNSIIGVSYLTSIARQNMEPRNSS